MNDTWNTTKSLIRKLRGIKPSGHGPFHEADHVWVDPKPYSAVRSNGIFEGYDNSVWMYFKFPEDVKIEWNKNPMEPVFNQHFLVDLVRDLANQLDNQTERTMRDERRKIHIPMTLDLQSRIKPYKGATPANQDYLNRMSSQYTKPVWTGYVGFQLMPSHAFTEAYGFMSRVERWMEMMKDPEALNFYLYKQDIAELTNKCLELGFQPLNFQTPEGREDFERLTAWHGVYDDDYGLPLALESTVMQEPVHSMSMITPRWGELTFHAIKPKDELFMVDPASESARWAKPIFRPGSEVVALNIRAEIRSSRVAENLFDSKRLVQIDRSDNISSSKTASQSDKEMEGAKTSKLNRARQASEAGHGLMDNVEITVARRVRQGIGNELKTALSGYNLEPVPLVGRQPLALNNTFPTYPIPIYPVKMSNRTRSPLSNQMFPGALAMSGIARSTKPAAPGGILLGLSEAGFEFTEIYTDLEGANKKSGSPGVLITGRPGAGKTQQMLQILHQVVYDNRGAVMLNLKPTSGTLKPSFDLMGGLTINMGHKYLENNPGVMDPVYFYKDRKEVASTLNQAIVMAAAMSEDRGVSAAERESQLNADLVDNAQDPRNLCSYHIIFGNDKAGTPPISDKGIRKLIQNKMISQPFWRAFISTDPNLAESNPLIRDLGRGVPVLIEWDKSLSLPTQSEVDKGKLSASQVDSLISSSVAFRYSVELIGDGGNGGVVAVDESWALKASDETRKHIESAGRAWRESNIMLLLGTQRLLDWLDPNETDFTTFFSRFIIMAIKQNDDAELDMYFKLTGLPREGRAGEANTRFIIEAGAQTDDDDGQRKRNRIVPRAYYIDQLYNFEGGIICGPWPKRELNAGRTDIEGRKSKEFGIDPEEETEMEYENLIKNIVEEDKSIMGIEDPNETESTAHSG